MNIPRSPGQIFTDGPFGFQTWRNTMAFWPQSEQVGPVGEATVIYEPSHPHRTVPTLIHAGLFTGIEPLSTSESCSTFSLAPLSPSPNHSDFTSSVSEYPGSCYSSGRTIPDPLNLHLEAGELGFHWGRKNASAEPPPLPDPGVSGFQALGGKSMGSLPSEDGLTSSETHQG